MIQCFDIKSGQQAILKKIGEALAPKLAATNTQPQGTLTDLEYRAYLMKHAKDLGLDGVDDLIGHMKGKYKLVDQNKKLLQMIATAKPPAPPAPPPVVKALPQAQGLMTDLEYRAYLMNTAKQNGIQGIDELIGKMKGKYKLVDQNKKLLQMLAQDSKGTPAPVPQPVSKPAPAPQPAPALTTVQPKGLMSDLDYRKYLMGVAKQIGIDGIDALVTKWKGKYKLDYQNKKLLEVLALNGVKLQGTTPMPPAGAGPVAANKKVYVGPEKSGQGTYYYNKYLNQKVLDAGATQQQLKKLAKITAGTTVHDSNYTKHIKKFLEDELGAVFADATAPGIAASKGSMSSPDSIIPVIPTIAYKMPGQSVASYNSYLNDKLQEFGVYNDPVLADKLMKTSYGTFEEDWTNQVLDFMQRELDVVIPQAPELPEVGHRLPNGLLPVDRNVALQHSSVSTYAKQARGSGASQWADFLKVLDDLELGAIRAYTGSSYSELNKYLRSGDTSGYSPKVLSEFANALDNALRKMKPYVGMVYRGTSMPQHRIDHYISAWKYKGTVSEAFFMSTAYQSSSSFGGEVKFAIKSKSGVKVKELSLHESENEVLFNRHTTFKVTDYQKSGHTHHFTLEEV
jgi:hypothetical protein